MFLSWDACSSGRGRNAMCHIASINVAGMNQCLEHIIYVQDMPLGSPQTRQSVNCRESVDPCHLQTTEASHLCVCSLCNCARSQMTLPMRTSTSFTPCCILFHEHLHLTYVHSFYSLFICLACIAIKHMLFSKTM